MKHNVFYGEYTLKHWIDLILRKKIIIPEFQRCFVWSKYDVENLIESIKDNSFIPPVMIGLYNKDDVLDIVIDGQQRLSSILIAYLNRYPEKFPKDSVALRFANENDDTEDDISENEKNWTFRDIQSLNIKSKEDIIKKIDTDRRYSPLSNNDLENDFFDKNYLGFSYIKMVTYDREEQKKFYAKLFRDINIGGKLLSSNETREALYWLDESKNEWFKPKWTKDIKIDKINDKSLDFARLLALATNYKKSKYISLAGYQGRGKQQKMEELIVVYIKSVICKEVDKCNLPDKWKENLEKLRICVEFLSLPAKNYTSIIDTDFCFLGLLYWVLLEGKTLDMSKKENLLNDVFSKSKEVKEKDSKHKKTPSAMKYVNTRITESISIYEKYLERGAENE